MSVRKRTVSSKESALADPVGPDRLKSWKEIARYLEREVRTVQLWEKFEGLPVHRHFHSHQSTIFAFRSEIEGWRRTRMVDRASSSASSACPEIKIMVHPADLPSCPLSELINETVEMLNMAGFETITDFETSAGDLVLRLQRDLEADCITVDFILAGSQAIVWSRSLDGETSPSALARSIALLSRSASIDKIWNVGWPVNIPSTPIDPPKLRPIAAASEYKGHDCAESGSLSNSHLAMPFTRCLRLLPLPFVVMISCTTRVGPHGGQANQGQRVYIATDDT